MTNLFSKQSPWGRRSAAIGSVLFVPAMFAACGDEVTEVTEVTQVVGMQVLNVGVALPVCSVDNEGAMVYSVDSAAAYTCIGGIWTSVKGKDGKDGTDGKDGKDGADGKDGKNGADGKDGKDGADGKNGKDGTNGTNGTSGKSCTAVAVDNGYKIVCGGDSVGVVLNGEDGQDGAKGDTGVAGTSCTAEEDSDGVKITCTDGKSFKLKNGVDGKDGESFVDGVMIDPRDKQIYRVVTIGEQTWMAENLNYADSVKTPSLLERSWCHSNNLDNCSKYGRLYTWAAAIDSVKLYKDSALDCGYNKVCSLPDTVLGICPPGWHLPDNTEWNKLYAAVGGKGTAGKVLKSTSGWKDYDGTSGNGTDDYGFSAFPAGYRDDDGTFVKYGLIAYFWSVSMNGLDIAWHVYLYHGKEDADLSGHYKNCGLPVRCLKD